MIYRFFAILLIFFMAVQVMGCSFFMNTVPDNWDQSMSLDCDSGYMRPIIEASVAGSAVIAAIILFAVAPSLPTCPPKEENSIFDGCWFPERTLARGSGVILSISAIVLGFSSGFGFAKASECRDACKNRDRFLRLNPEQQEEVVKQWRKEDAENAE